MTSDEFEKWFARAEDLFPGVGNYFAKANDAAAVKRRWFEILQHYEFRDAKVSIDRMYEGDIEAPRSMAELPKVLKGLLRRGGGTVSTTERVKCRCLDCGKTFRLDRLCYWCKSDNWSIERDCPHCDDLGVVMIWSLEAMQAMQKAIADDGTCEPKRYQVESVRCSCERGSDRRWPKGKFNANSMCPASQPLRPFIENAMGVGAARTNGFDAWNESTEGDF